MTILLPYVLFIHKPLLAITIRRNDKLVGYIRSKYVAHNAKATPTTRRIDNLFVLQIPFFESAKNETSKSRIIP